MGDNEELWTACTEQGELVSTGGGLTKNQAAAGDLHASCGVWLWRDNDGVQEILTARRSETVHTWPGAYGLSAGGHVVFGASLLQTAVQETREELGLKVDPEGLGLLMTYRSYMAEAGDGITENDLAFIYGGRVEGNPEIRFTDDEVSEVRWMGLVDLMRLMAGAVPGMTFVPQGAAVSAMMAQLLGQQWQRYKAGDYDRPAHRV